MIGKFILIGDNILLNSSEVSAFYKVKQIVNKERQVLSDQPPEQEVIYGIQIIKNVMVPVLDKETKQPKRDPETGEIQLQPDVLFSPYGADREKRNHVFLDLYRVLVLGQVPKTSLQDIDKRILEYKDGDKPKAVK